MDKNWMWGDEMPRDLLTCCICRKQSDGAQSLHGFVLCGAHYDEALRHAGNADVLASFIHKLRDGKYRACWAAKVDG